MAYYTDAHIAGTLGSAWNQLNPTQQAHYINRFREEQAGDAFYAANPVYATAAVQAALTPSAKAQVAELARTDASAYVLGATVPPLPHPDASNLSLGPNLGGADAVTFPGESSASAMPGGTGGGGSGLGGLLLLAGGGLLLFSLLRKK